MRVGPGLILVVVAALGVAAGFGCGGSEGEGPSPDPAPGESPIVREGDLAGQLHVMPVEAEPGDEVRIAVENHGDARLMYGLGAEVDGYDDGEWARAFPPDPVFSVGILARPGERAGPRYSEMLIDLVHLPADLEPGVYRASKRVGRRLRRSEDDFALTATFEVSPAG